MLPFSKNRRRWNDQLSLHAGSSQGRGPRCAAWFADYVAQNGEFADYIEDEKETGDVLDEDIMSFTLAGGIKGWVNAGSEYALNVDRFVPEYWRQFNEPAKR